MLSALALATVAVFTFLACRLSQIFSAKKSLFARGDVVLFVTAHPDDECMFFSPSVISAVQQAGAPSVHVLCLSTGNYYAQGDLRRTELVASCNRLGVPPGNVFIVDSPTLQDGSDWSPRAVASQVSLHLTKLNYTKLVTFDAHGVSGHGNHISVFRGIRYLLNGGELPEDMQVFTLRTVTVFLKYTAVLSCVLPAAARSTSLVSDIYGWKTGISAMLQHRSQLLWFRYLYIAASSYMWTNTLTRLHEGDSDS